MKYIKQIIYLAIAIFFLSFSFNVFQAPNGLVTGGVTGIVLILNEILHVSIPRTTFIINSLFLILGLSFLGKEFFFKTVIGSIFFYPLFLTIIPEIKVSDDLLVNALCGGILMGIGISFLYLSKGSSGGTSLLARILIKYINIPFASAIFIFDGTIILVGFAIFGIESGIYALILVFTSTLLANYVESKFTTYNQVIILSDNVEINDIVKNTLTLEKEVVTLKNGIHLCVVKNNLITQFKDSILKVDKDSIIIISEAKVEIHNQ